MSADSSPPPVPSPTTTPEPYRCTRCWWNGMARSLADAQQQHWHANVACTKAASYSSVEPVAPSAPLVDGARPSAPPSDPMRCTNGHGEPAMLDEQVDEVCGTGFYHLEMLGVGSAFLQLGERVFTVFAGKSRRLVVRYQEDRPGRSGDGDPTPPPDEADKRIAEATERLAALDHAAKRPFSLAHDKASSAFHFMAVSDVRYLLAALASQRAARARAEQEVRLTGCCTRCGSRVAIEWGRVNDTVCHHVTASCRCRAPLNLWPTSAPAGQPEAVSRDA